MTETATTSDKPPESLTLDQVVSRVAGSLAAQGFPTGLRAELKRLVPGREPGTAFWRFAFRHLPDGAINDPVLEDWQTILAGMALMSPHHHQRGRHFGEVLASNGFSELRLERLLQAEPETMRILVLRAARFLGAKQQPFDWVDVASLLFARNADAAERVRRRIARDYYRNLKEE